MNIINDIIPIFSHDFGKSFSTKCKTLVGFDYLLFYYHQTDLYDTCPNAKLYKNLFLICKEFAEKHEYTISSEIVGRSARIVIKADRFIFSGEEELKFLSLLAKGKAKLMISMANDEVYCPCEISFDSSSSFICSKIYLTIAIPIEEAFVEHAKYLSDQ